MPARWQCSSTVKGSCREDPRGERIRDDSYIVLFNANRNPIEFTLSSELVDDSWVVEVDSARTFLRRRRDSAPVTSNAPLTVAGFSVTVLRRLEPPPTVT